MNGNIKNYKLETLNEFNEMDFVVFNSILGGETTDSEVSLNPLDWWRKWKGNRRLRRIIDILKKDTEVMEFLKKPESQQRGKWKILLKSKLGEEDHKFINSISRNQVRTSQGESNIINENLRMQFLAGLITEEQYKNLL